MPRAPDTCVSDGNKHAEGADMLPPEYYRTSFKKGRFVIRLGPACIYFSLKHCCYQLVTAFCTV